MRDPVSNAYNIADLREFARRRLPKGLFEFMDRGTEDEVSLRNNREVFQRIRFKPRTLVDVSARSQEVTLFGVPQKMPVIVAPTGTAGLAWYRGELALARATAQAGIPFALATGSMTSMEEIAEQSGGAELWFQLYMWPDRSLSHKVVERALTTTHGRFWRGLSNRFIGENADPHLAPALHKPRDRSTSGFDLARVNPATIETLEAP